MGKGEETTTSSQNSFKTSAPMQEAFFDKPTANSCRKIMITALVRKQPPPQIGQKPYWLLGLQGNFSGTTEIE